MFRQISWLYLFWISSQKVFIAAYDLFAVVIQMNETFKFENRDKPVQIELFISFQMNKKVKLTQYDVVYVYKKIYKQRASSRVIIAIVNLLFYSNELT